MLTLTSHIARTLAVLPHDTLHGGCDCVRVDRTVQYSTIKYSTVQQTIVHYSTDLLESGQITPGRSRQTADVILTFFTPEMSMPCYSLLAPLHNRENKQGHCLHFPVSFYLVLPLNKEKRDITFYSPL